MNPSKIPAQHDSQYRIETDPAVLGGKPYIRDTRLSVEFLQGLLATGWSRSRILDVYQYLADDDLSAVLVDRSKSANFAPARIKI
jgi:uncharacterized protein (DUF433 family)